MKSGGIVVSVLLVLVFSVAGSAGDGDLPELVRGSKINAHVPPEGSVRASDQWPEVGWIEHHGVRFVVYAKHASGYSPSSEGGHFEVWIGPPPEYIAEVEKRHPYGPADAHRYLMRAGFDTMVARFYEGPGDNWVDPRGYVPWTRSSDRLRLCVYRPAVGKLAPKAYASHEIYLGSPGGALIGKLYVTCKCPRYDRAEGKPAHEHWIGLLLPGARTPLAVDQWGLPGCSPLPEARAESSGTTKPTLEGPEQRILFADHEVLELRRGNRIVAQVPPHGAVSATRQWPVVGHVEHEGVRFTVYAKHLSGCDPQAGTGRFEVWLAPPPEYITAVEKDHPFGPADALRYLQRSGFDRVVARLYEGPGDTWTDPRGYEPWTAATDRLRLVYRPENGRLAPNTYALHEIRLGSADGPQLFRGHVQCYCPDYRSGSTKPSDEAWINLLVAGKQRHGIEQWGLPGAPGSGN